MSKELKAKIQEWIDLYDKTEEHSAEFSMDLKDDARLLFEELLKEEYT